MIKQILIDAFLIDAIETMVSHETNVKMKLVHTPIGKVAIAIAPCGNITLSTHVKVNSEFSHKEFNKKFASQVSENDGLEVIFYADEMDAESVVKQFTTGFYNIK